MGLQEEIELEILKNITHTQNQKSMAEEIGYSVGKVNYILKGLIQKGLIKSEKFLNSNNKIQYKYLLTEEGIKEKIDITEKSKNKKQTKKKTQKKKKKKKKTPKKKKKKKKKKS